MCGSFEKKKKKHEFLYSPTKTSKILVLCLSINEESYFWLRRGGLKSISHFSLSESIVQKNEKLADFSQINKFCIFQVLLIDILFSHYLYSCVLIKDRLLFMQYLFIKNVQGTLGRTKATLPSAAHFVCSGNVRRALTYLSLRWIDIRRAGGRKGL